jgi:hypothetical protein
VPPAGLPPGSVKRASALYAYPDENVSMFVDVPTAGSFGALTPGLDQTRYFADAATGILWIRIVAVPAGNEGAAIQLHTDGLGQVIQVNL